MKGFQFFQQNSCLKTKHSAVPKKIFGYKILAETWFLFSLKRNHIIAFALM
jgi:hypothetical protein